MLPVVRAYRALKFWITGLACWGGVVCIRAVLPLLRRAALEWHPFWSFLLFGAVFGLPWLAVVGSIVWAVWVVIY